jgi:hypothetical protein
MSEEPEEVFGTFPPGARVGFGVIAVVLLVLGLTCIGLTLLPLPGKATTPVLKIYLAFGGAAFLFGAFMSAMAAGPNTIAFDYTRQVYWSERGFPFLAKRKTGSFAEIEGLFLRTTPGRNFEIYHLMIAWKDRKQPERRLQIYANLETAQEEARLLAERLGVPCNTQPISGGGA